MRCIVVNAVAVFSHSNERLFDLPDDFSDRFELYGAEADIARPRQTRSHVIGPQFCSSNSIRTRWGSRYHEFGLRSDPLRIRPDSSRRPWALFGLTVAGASGWSVDWAAGAFLRLVGLVGWRRGLGVAFWCCSHWTSVTEENSIRTYFAKNRNFRFESITMNLVRTSHSPSNWLIMEMNTCSMDSNWPIENAPAVASINKTRTSNWSWHRSGTCRCR